MRLTLRTLLAYLDDTLEPAQARLIGQKIAESAQAQDVIKLIQQVTRRRRITTPPDGGPGGKLDANTLGEYLDNAISPEQAAEVEEICLASDTHLAEIAACHQILSLILGEPALVPPPATQRMYGLVKGPEAIPFRKPPASTARVDQEISEGRDVDDTLRLGIAPVTGKNRGNPWLLVLGGIGAACLLIVAVWQILRGREEGTPEPAGNNAVVQVEPKPPIIEEKKGAGDEKKQPHEENDKKEKKDDKKSDEVPLPEVKLPAVAIDVPWAPPSGAIKAAGKVASDPKDPGILVQYLADKSAWERIGPKDPNVVTGRPLISLPAAKSVIELESGLQLALVGSVFPELFYPIPLYESSVELHANDQLDLDLTLRRGRIRVLSPERQARVRVRYDNPTQPNQNDFFDITLTAPGTEVLVDRWSFPPNEKFFRNPKDPNRVGPVASTTCVVLSGSVHLRANDVTLPLSAPPGPALIFWSSVKGLDRPVDMKVLPDGLKSLPPLPPGIEPRDRAEALRARDDLQQQTLTKAVDVALAEALKSPNPGVRRLAVHGLGAVDDISGLLEQLEQETAPDLRLRAIEALRHWLASGRDHDYKLYDALKDKYRTIEAETIVTLLHGLNDKDLMNPDTYDLLISYLTHPQLPVRELAYWHLFQLVPAGQKIRYNAAGDAASRRQAQTAWRALIPPNQLPPMPMKK
ncbi:MAG: HEAT repeat domain-containing protein [Gemmataceae bacterium]|nr:HEAT repeat domain-containing protein [Gemmataceae bacterium]